MTLLPDQLAAVLGREILAGRIAPGDVVRLEDLAQDHDVSRTVAREVVKGLSQLGLLEVRRRVGSVVADPSQWNELHPLLVRWRLESDERLATLAHINELRRGVEPVAARLAAERATPERAGALLQAAVGMSATAREGDLEAYLAHDVDFHGRLLAASGNPMMACLAGVVEEALAGRTHHHLMPATPNEDAVVWHLQVAVAVLERNPEQAETTMRQIVDEAHEATVEMAAGSGA